VSSRIERPSDRTRSVLDVHLARVERADSKPQAQARAAVRRHFTEEVAVQAINKEFNAWQSWTGCISFSDRQ
jgi:ssRNA-specific RNase YbeY (16S rRNA maturation enzyme)